MPVHYGGQSADMTRIMDIAEKHNLYVIEDSAETIGGTHHGQLTGTFGIGCFSFYPTKNLTTGEGGMLTTEDDDLAQRVKAMLAHGIDKSTYEREDKEKAWFRSASRIGYNFRMSNILAAIGVEQLKKLPEMNRLRRDLAARLTNALSEIEEIIPPVERSENKHVYQMYTIRLQGKQDRDEFVRRLNLKGIGASIHFFPPVHHMNPYQGQEFKRDDLSNTEKVIQEIVTLPMYPQMTDDDLEYMIDTIKETISSFN
jgi:perosamine synthetase